MNIEEPKNSVSYFSSLMKLNADFMSASNDFLNRIKNGDIIPVMERRYDEPVFVFKTELPPIKKLKEDFKKFKKQNKTPAKKVISFFYKQRINYYSQGQIVATFEWLNSILRTSWSEMTLLIISCAIILDDDNQQDDNY